MIGLRGPLTEGSMDIPETEKLDVNALSTRSRSFFSLRPVRLFCYLSLSLFLFFFSPSYGLGATFDGKPPSLPRWFFPPFFSVGERKEKKKTISLIFHRVQGHWDNHSVKPTCFPTFTEYSVALSLALQSRRRIKGMPQHLSD